MEESVKVNEGVDANALPPSSSHHGDDGHYNGIAAVTDRDIAAAVQGEHGANVHMTREAPHASDHMQPQDPQHHIAHNVDDVTKDVVPGQILNQIGLNDENGEVGGGLPNHGLHVPHHPHSNHADPSSPNVMASPSVMPAPSNILHGPGNVLPSPSNIMPAPSNMIGETPTATEADIVAIAGEAAVAAVEAGEAVATTTQGLDGDKKPEALKTEEDMKAADIVSVLPKIDDADMHHHHPGEIPPDVAMDLSAAMGHPGNIRRSSEAGLPEGPEKTKRARRKAEPIKPFNDMLYELMAFRSREGHCRVPVDNKSALGRWVASLRSQYSSLQKGYPTADLTEERLMILRNIDFIWDLQQFDSDARWKRQFEELVAYKRENGHCNAPQSTPLGKWVKMQRENYRETQLRAQGALPQNRTKPRPTLSEERIAQLNSIGFQWKVAPPAAGWEHRYEELVEYKRLHGDCNVPQAWPENRQLGRWVMKQRCQYTLRQKGDRCQITDERIQRLNDLGFSWTAPSFRKNKKGEKEFDIRPKWL